MSQTIVGRVMTVWGTTGHAEFRSGVRVGDLIYYKDLDNQRKVVCKVVALRSAPVKGIYGTFEILDKEGALPRSYTDLFMVHQPADAGFIEVGTDVRGRTVKLQVNPFFRHTLVAGMTQQGKTHLLIVLVEDFLKLSIPTLVLDTQGELIHINEVSDRAVVTEKLRIQDLIKLLKERRTVVYNLQGLAYGEKTQRACEILSKLMSAKERDYKQTETRPLQIPPVLVVIDEAEIYAPEHNVDADTECKEALVDIAKRGSKYGIGLVLTSQRLPQLELELRSQCNSAAVFHVCDDGSLKVLRMLPYISSLELNRLRNFAQGQCMLAGQVVNEQPTTVFIRDIKTKRAKSVDFEEILGLEKPKTETGDIPLVMAEELSPIPKETKSIPCPDCGSPLTYNRKKGAYECTNERCSFLQLKAGQVSRSPVIGDGRASEESLAPPVQA